MKKILIMGAAGRDFHVFNVCYRARPDVRVVGFSAAQIPHIDARRYPPPLAGEAYPNGIEIFPEAALETWIRDEAVDEVVFAYSDVPIAHLDATRRRVELAGARFRTFDVDATMLPSSRPLIAVTAVRTGCGKSQTTRWIAARLREAGLKVVAIRHPMPYGNLAAQAVQRFATLDDLDHEHCTIEEREEYEPHIATGGVVYAGVDYGAIGEQAEAEADVILWDGGNNDTPFYRPDLWITIADPHRAGDELTYFPSAENFRRCDVLLINKVDSADAADIHRLTASCRRENPRAVIIQTRSPVTVDNPGRIHGKRVLVVEDGPTLTHGGMTFGAGMVAAKAAGAAEIVDPRPWLKAEIAETFKRYPAIGPLLPAMGYGDQQVADLEATINAVDCDLVLIATPVDLTRVMTLTRPALRVRYELDEPTGLLERTVLEACRQMPS